MIIEDLPLKTLRRQRDALRRRVVFLNDKPKQNDYDRAEIHALATADVLFGREIDSRTSRRITRTIRSAR